MLISIYQANLWQFLNEDFKSRALTVTELCTLSQKLDFWVIKRAIKQFVTGVSTVYNKNPKMSEWESQVVVICVVSTYAAKLIFQKDFYFILIQYRRIESFFFNSNSLFSWDFS